MAKNGKKQHANKYAEKIKYKKKKVEPTVEEEVKQEVIEEQKSTSEETKKLRSEPKIVQPSEKYKAIVEALRRKTFFVDARFGNKIHFNNITDFRTDKKDVPTVVVVMKVRNRQGETKEITKIFRIIKYNDNEIIGMNSRNFNYYVLPKVDVDMTPIPRPPKKQFNKNNNFNKNKSYNKLNHN